MVHSKSKQLSVLLLCAATAVAHVLPSRTHVSHGRRLAVAPRAQATFVTMYGLFDESSYSGPRTSGKPRLPPVGEVYVAMLSSSLANSPPTASATAAGEQPIETLPPLGPGIVLLPPTPTLLFSAPTDTQADAATPSGMMAPAAPSRVVLLSSVVGGILLLTLCLFFLLNPKVSGKAGDFLRFTKRVAKRRQNEPSEKEVPANGSELAWAGVQGATFGADSHRAESESPTSSPEKLTEKRVPEDGPPTPTAPALSKFSGYSADYLGAQPLPRPESVATSDYASTNGTIAPGKEVNVAPAKAPPAQTGPPPRPPRPPTADSPALSDSVYLACSDQPYVIVVPKRLSRVPAPAEPPAAAAESAPRKVLTPSEFITLHGAGTAAADTRHGGGAPAARETKAEKDRVVSFQPSPKRDSVHARTKSAPLFSFMLGRSNTTASTSSSFSAVLDRRSFATTSGGYMTSSDSEADRLTESGISKKVLKHRRSRSASGWAYPERDRQQQKVKKFFSIEAPSLLR